MLSNIPIEMRALDQWVVSGVDKLPKNPRTGEIASVTDSATWGSFDQAMASQYPNKGFVLTQADPYIIIDLDDKAEKPATEEERARHQHIIEVADSYTERSVSGRGYHIIIKGILPDGKGLRRGTVEVYSEGRYMICTGNQTNQKRIEERQEITDHLIREMGGGKASTATLDETTEDKSDQEVWESAQRLAPAKFDELWKGGFLEHPSQSEADLDLVGMLCQCSKSNEQIRRLFRMSSLGKREKAVRNDKYIDYTLKRVRANEPPPIDFEQIEVAAQEVLNPVPVKQKASSTVVFPPGLVGEIAEFVLASSPRPVREVALAAGIGLVAGISGRAYNISGNGLAQYIVLVANTGRGKEASTSGINKLINTIRPNMPMIDMFRGPATFASGQALIRVMDEQPCFVAMLGEFGLTLKMMSDPKANQAIIMLRKVLLDIWSKSGPDNILASTAYADKEKNTKIVTSPNMTIIGDCTATTFFEGLDASHVADGLLPRLSLIEYKGRRPELVEDAHLVQPQKELLTRLTELGDVCIKQILNSTPSKVIQMTPEAKEYLLRYNDRIDALMNELPEAAVDQDMLSRAYQKALKIAGLLAVGFNHHNPTVTLDQAKWAAEFTDKSTNVITSRFESGDVGQGDGKQIFDTKRLIVDYLAKGGSGQKALHAAKIVPYIHLARRTANLSAFKNDRKGANGALRNVLDVLVESGQLVEIPKATLVEKYKFSGKAYALTLDFVKEG